MLRISVSLEIDLALKPLLAESACERLVPGVLAHVRDQIGRLAERLPTHHTNMRLFTYKIINGKCVRYCLV